jgi:hypothetical protein
MKSNVQSYVAPAMEIIPLEAVSVMAGSGDLRGGSISTPSAPGGSTYSSNPYHVGPASTGAELDDLINDILTVGQ